MSCNMNLFSSLFSGFKMMNNIFGIHRFKSAGSLASIVQSTTESFNTIPAMESVIIIV